MTESFPALDAIPGIRALFLGRIAGIDARGERADVMARLASPQQLLLGEKGLSSFPLVTAEQVHGSNVTVVDSPAPDPIKEADGLLTMTRGITLGIHVADCAPVWIVARDGSAGAVVHSGKKGTELGIVTLGIRALGDQAGIAPRDLVVVIGPCIRPPCYEVDFAATIRNQAAEEGVMEIHDDGVCTACHPVRYYSYRREKGLTGRKLANLTLLP
jgi:hypothetical protein